MANVRVFAHSAVLVLPTAIGTDRSGSDSVYLLPYPYLARQQLTVTSPAVETDAAPYGTVLWVVESDSPIYFEVTPKGHQVRVADTGSPLIRNRRELIYSGEGWKLSFLAL